MTSETSSQLSVSSSSVSVSSKAVHEIASPSTSEGVTVVTDDLSYSVPIQNSFMRFIPGVVRQKGTRKTILRHVNICAKPGELFGIVGPSGGGKTTLLNLLAGRGRPAGVEGQVCYNGRSQKPEQIKVFANYVMAHDKLHPLLTVAETIYIAAKLKLPEFTKDQRQSRVERVIESMSLQRCRNTYIGGEGKKGVSTGEMKRVSIAIELLDDPQLLLLDEPTSGLDSSLAYEVMQVLVGLSKKENKTIILTIHQPRSQVFSLIDTLVLLSHGSVLFHGPPSSVCWYFAGLGYPCPADWNPADFLLDLVAEHATSQDTEDASDALYDHPSQMTALPSDDCTSQSSGKDKVSRKTKICFENEDFMKSVSNSSAGKGSVISVGTLSYQLTPHQIAQLTVSFSNSGLGIGVRKAVVASLENPVPLPGVPDSASKIFRHCQKDTWINWFIQTRTLWKRSFLNSARNPLVACVMVLLHLLQGLILGGIFFQLNRDISGVEPTEFSTDWLNSTWGQVYNYGIDGNGMRPFVEMVERGVDGGGSRPLYEIVMNDTYSSFIHDFLHCAHDKYGLNQTYDHYLPPQDYPWPTYPPNEFPEPTAPERVLHEIFNLRSAVAGLIDDLREDDSIEKQLVISSLYDSRDLYGLHSDGVTVLRGTCQPDDETQRGRELGGYALSTTSSGPSPYAVVSDLTTALQILDYFIFRADYSDAEVCLDKLDSSLEFYLCVMTHGKTLLNPLLNCTGFPDLPDLPFGGATSLLKDVEREGRMRGRMARRLATSSDYSEWTTMLSPAMQGFINGTLDIVDRISACDNDLCHAIVNSLDSTSHLLMDAGNTIFVVINVAGCLFFAAATLGFASYDALLTFPQERAVFNHETANGLYRTSCYFIGKNLADLPFQLAPALTLITVYYWMVGLAPTASQFFTYFGICGMTTFCAYGFGYMVSAASPRMEIAILVAPTVLVMFLVLAGFFLRDPDIPAWISWFKYFSFYRWSFFGMMVNQFPPGEYYGSLPCSLITSLCGVTEPRVWLNCVILISLALGYRLLSFFFLKFTNRRAGLER